MEIEQDEDLVVPRSQISPGLYNAIGEGDLTGLTLFNLQACGRAFQFLNGSNVTAYGSYIGMESSSDDESNWETVQSVLQMAGMGELLETPIAKSMARVVMFDTRLAHGIPNFFKLVTKMYEDMLAYNEIDLPCILVFMSTVNFDANMFLGDVGEPVPGAVSEAIHIETNASEWEASRESSEEDDTNAVFATADEDCEDGSEEASERDAMIAMLRLLTLTAELTGKSPYPQELLDELERAENGDESVDLNDLAERLNACTPDTQAADLSNVTFDDGNVVEGRRFKMSYPDGWTAIKDYEESMLFMTQTRPFVIVQGEATAEDDLSNFDRIVYSSLGGDAEIGEVDEMCGFDDKHWALRWYNCYDRSDSEDIASMKPIVVWDTEIDAVNTKCLVTQQQTKAEGANGLEFDVYPYAADHMDSLRFVFTYEEDMDIEPVRNLVLKMAESIELDDPYVPNCMKTLEKAVSSKVSVEEFVEMVDHVSKPYIALHQMIFTASQYKYASAADDFDDDECTLAGAQGIADLCNRSVSKFEKMMDAYDAQVAAGYTIGELDRLLDALESFNREVYPTTEIFDYDDARLIKKKGIFDETDELRSVRERLKYAKQHGGMASKPSGAKASAAAAVSFTPSTQAKAREKTTISEPFKTNALPRIEKALNEKVSSSYFIETSEIAANALMSARQEACDEETSPWNSDEDNVTGMARAFAKFNSIICRYYGHFVNALEAQVELGTTPGEIKRMAAEVNEFGELVADRFSCGNPYLDEVANSRTPVTRPVEYASIRARWQKINSC